MIRARSVSKLAQSVQSQFLGKVFFPDFAVTPYRFSSQTRAHPARLNGTPGTGNDPQPRLSSLYWATGMLAAIAHLSISSAHSSIMPVCEGISE
jgi:hypothetical protein